MERWGFMLLVATIAGTVYFLPDCFVDRYFTSGQLWVCGIAGAWGIFALWRAKRCSYLGMAVGGVLLVAWGYGFVSGYLGWQALGWRVALWLLLLVAENWEGGFSYRKAYFVLALSLGVEAIVGIGQYAGLWQGNGQFRVTGTFENPAGLAALFFLLLGLIGREEKQIHWQGRRWRLPFISISLALVVFTGYWAKQEALWRQLSRMSLQGNFAEAEQGYRELYPFLRENPLFLYNYGAELHYAGRWSESLSIMEECAEGLDDTDVQMLLGDACERIGNDAGAERHFRQAASMCPVRFVPPYRLVKLYERTGRHEKAACLAAELAGKPVKVPSYMVAKIKREMRDFIRCEQNE